MDVQTVAQEAATWFGTAYRGDDEDQPISGDDALRRSVRALRLDQLIDLLVGRGDERVDRRAVVDLGLELAG